MGEEITLVVNELDAPSLRKIERSRIKTTYFNKEQRAIATKELKDVATKMASHRLRFIATYDQGVSIHDFAHTLFMEGWRAFLHYEHFNNLPKVINYSKRTVHNRAMNLISWHKTESRRAIVENHGVTKFKSEEKFCKELDPRVAKFDAIMKWKFPPGFLLWLRRSGLEIRELKSSVQLLVNAALDYVGAENRNYVETLRSECGVCDVCKSKRSNYQREFEPTRVSLDSPVTSSTDSDLSLDEFIPDSSIGPDIKMDQIKLVYELNSTDFAPKVKKLVNVILTGELNGEERRFGSWLSRIHNTSINNIANDYVKLGQMIREFYNIKSRDLDGVKEVMRRNNVEPRITIRHDLTEIINRAAAKEKMKERSS